MFVKKKTPIKASEIASYLNKKFYGKDVEIETFSSINNIKNNSLIFFTKIVNSSFEINEKKVFDENLLNNKKNILILIDKDINIKNQNITYISSNNPRFDFEDIIANFFTHEEFEPGISSSAIVENDAIINPTAYIGPNCHIGSKVCIGKNTKIMANTVINSNTYIGNNCRIKNNTSIGGEGFSFAKNEERFIHFPHTGKVLIEDDVWIGSSVTIEKGTIDNTIIKTGVKIDDLVHIGHNSFLGDNSQITVGAIILGRAILGKNCWLSPGSVIDNGVEIGDNSLIGVNTHIRKNVESNCIISGNPPRLIRKVKID